MIAAASGGGDTGPDLHSHSFEPLQHALEVSNDVVVALLRIHDRTGVTLASDLAKSAVQYHAAVDDLAAMNVDDPLESEMVKQAQAALLAGRFTEVEAELRQIEDREVAALGRLTGASPALEAYNEHQLVASQARALLGTIALMKMEYSEAAEDFLAAHKLLLLTPSEEPGVIQPRPVAATGTAGAAEPSHEQAAATAVAAPIDVHDATAVRPPDAAPPSIAHDEAAVAPERVTTAMVQPTAMKPAATPDRPQSAFAPFAEAVAKLPPAVAALSTEPLQLLLHRGDAMLALGDIGSARLFYARAASAGDAHGAIGVAKTYDPRVLSQMGVRGIQADPAAAVFWHRKALDLGDASAAMKPAATPDRPQSAFAPFAEAVAKLPPAVAAPSTEQLQLLLHRGDAMLALGDIGSARLFYARAASAGDAHGAIGVAKTYDPRVLSQMGVRGIQADPAAAVFWYRKALDLGDASAAVPLRQLGQGLTHDPN